MKRRQNPNQDIIEFKWCWVTVRDTKSVYTKGPMSPSGQSLPKWVVRDMSGFPPGTDIARCLKCVANRP
jgi:hypothetical protein